jgi:polysaccharide biosynthesis transport protein
MSSEAPQHTKLPEQPGLTVADYLEILRRRKWELIWSTVLLFSIVALVAAVLPNKYTSVARILIEQAEIPDEFVRTTILAGTRQQLGATTERVLTTENLQAIIEKHALYPDRVEKTSVGKVAGEMYASVKVEWTHSREPGSGLPEGAVGFLVAYKSRVPETAQIVVEDLTALFLRENALQRQQAARETTQFLTRESDRLAKEISEVEARLALFKEANMNVLPENQNLNMQLMQRAEEQFQRNDQDLRASDARIANLRSQLAELNPSPHLDRVMALEAEYASLAATYTDKHPDRIRVRRELETLRQDAGGIERVTNPAFIQLQNQVQDAMTERQLHLSTRASIQERLGDLEQRLSRTPIIEVEYRNLTREHDTAIAKLQDLRAKMIQAELAESLEAESRSERYVLLRPAFLPTRPSSPNRRALFLLGFVFALGGGAGTVVLRENLDNAVHGTKGVTRATGVPPLAVIPYLRTDAELAALRKRRRLVSLAVVALLAAALVFVHYQVQPLDELFSDGLEQSDPGPEDRVGTER